jgi:hypothetical protein
MRSTFDIVLMPNGCSFPSKLVPWINKAKEHAIVVTTDLEIQQYCPHATIIDRDPVECDVGSDDDNIDDIIYDRIRTSKTTKLVVLYDCFWDGQNKLLDRVYEHFQHSPHYKLVLVTQYGASVYLHRNRKFHVADRIYVPDSMVDLLRTRGAPWLHKRYRKTPWLSWHRRRLEHNFSPESLRSLHLRYYHDGTRN